MGEKRYQVRPVLVRLMCDDCGAEMKRDKWMLATNPPKVQYQCPKCGKRTVSAKVYPDVEWIPGEELEVPHA